MRKKINFKLGKTNFEYFLPQGVEESDFLKDCEEVYNLLINNFFNNDEEVIIDVGARDGDSIFPFFAALKNKNIRGKIIGVEPSEEFEWLVKNCNHNKMNDVLFFNFAISNVDGKVQFVWDEKGRNGGIDHQFSRIGSWDSSRVIESKSFNNFPHDLKSEVEKATFIKIDTEGSDLIVMNELISVIEKNRPILMVENWPFTQRYIFEFTELLNYKLFNMKLQRNQFDTHNLILIPS